MSRHRKHDLPRINWLRAQHAGHLQAMAASEKLPDRIARSPSGVFDHLLAFDPTPKGIYVQRIIEWLLDGRIRFEDARTVRDTLSDFHAKKAILPEVQRDIRHHADPASLSKLLDAGAERDAIRVPMHISEGSRQVAAGEDWSLHRVTTPAAAKWWSKDTRWCTTNVRNAENYLMQDDLLVLVVGKDKWQVHAESDQFADIHDQMLQDFTAIPAEPLAALREELRKPSRLGSPFQRVDIAARIEKSQRSSTTKPAKPFSKDDNKEIWQHVESGSTLEFVSWDLPPTVRDANGKKTSLDTSFGKRLQRDIAQQFAHRASSGADGGFILDRLSWLTSFKKRFSSALSIVEGGALKAVVMQIATEKGLVIRTIDARTDYLEATLITDHAQYRALDEDLRACVRRYFFDSHPGVAIQCIIGLESLDPRMLNEIKGRLSGMDCEHLSRLSQQANRTDLERIEQIVRHGISTPAQAQSILDSDRWAFEGFVRDLVEDIACASRNELAAAI